MTPTRRASGRKAHQNPPHGRDITAPAANTAKVMSHAERRLNAAMNGASA
jgi:hypothetical protein